MEYAAGCATGAGVTLTILAILIHRRLKQRPCKHRYVRCIYPVGGPAKVECVECSFSYTMSK